MTTVSVGRALKTGAGLVLRYPEAFVLWAVIYVILGVLPSLLIWWRAGPEYVDLFHGMIAAKGKVDPALATALNRQVGPINNLNLLFQLVLMSVFGAAVFRAVLRPEQRNAGFVRLGVAELSIGAVIVIYYVGFIAVIVAATIIAIVALVAAGVSAGGAAIGVAVAAIALIAFGWVVVRLSLVMPMIVADNRFHLFEGWRLSRGVQLKLLLLLLAMMGIGLAYSVVVGAADFAVIGGKVGASGLGWGGFFSRGGQAVAHDLVPTMTPVLVVLAVGSAFLQTVFAGAWADVYRQIAGEETEAVFA